MYPAAVFGASCYKLINLLLVLFHRGSVDQTLGTESSVLANRRVMKNEGMEHSEVKSLEDQFRDTLPAGENK